MKTPEFVTHEGKETTATQNVKNFLIYSQDVRTFVPQYNEMLAEWLTARAALVQNVGIDRTEWRKRMKDYWMNLLDAVVDTTTHPIEPIEPPKGDAA